MNDKNVTPTNTVDDKDFLSQPVTIHFTEDSIPGLRLGELMEESKQALLAWRSQSVGEAEDRAILKVVSHITTDKGDAYYENVPLWRYKEQLEEKLNG